MENNDWEKYVKAENDATFGRVRLTFGLLGFFIAYMAYAKIIQTNSVGRVGIMVLGILVSVGCFYSLFRKK